MMSKKVNVAIVGLGFRCGVHSDLSKPSARRTCMRFVSVRKMLNQIGDHFGVEKRYTSFEELHPRPEVDAVHINTPIAAARIEIASPRLEAGKHVACTVPMATSIDESGQIVEAERRTARST